jgi:class 3 adenylate cyclase
VNGGSCCILVGESTWERVHGEFRGHLLGNLPLKGKKRKVQVYRIFTDDAEADMILAAEEYRKRIESASDLNPTIIGRVG